MYHSFRNLHSYGPHDIIVGIDLSSMIVLKDNYIWLSGRETRRLAFSYMITRR